METLGFGFGQSVLDDIVDARTAWTAAKATAKLIEIAGLASRDDFHFAILCVAHPPAQFKLAGLTLHEPAKANTLHATLNEEVNNHGNEPGPVLQMGARRRKRRG